MFACPLRCGVGAPDGAPDPPTAKPLRKRQATANIKRIYGKAFPFLAIKGGEQGLLTAPCNRVVGNHQAVKGRYLFPVGHKVRLFP